MKRRGILGLLGMGGAAIATKADANQATLQQAADLRQANWLGQQVEQARADFDTADGREDEKKWQKFRRMRGRHPGFRSIENKRALAAQFGGLAPHLATMHSNALWFRAMQTTKWHEQLDREHRRLNRDLRQIVFGFLPEWMQEEAADDE